MNNPYARTVIPGFTAVIPTFIVPQTVASEPCIPQYNGNPCSATVIYSQCGNAAPSSVTFATINAYTF